MDLTVNLRKRRINETLDKITSPIRLHRSKNFSKFFENFSIVSWFQKIPEIGRAETIHLVQKSSNFELSSRFSGCLKIFIGQGSLYSLEPIFQTLDYFSLAFEFEWNSNASFRRRFRSIETKWKRNERLGKPARGAHVKRDDILRWVALSDCAERFRN